MPSSFLSDITSIESLTIGSGISDYDYTYRPFWDDISNMNLKELICTSTEPQNVSCTISLAMLEKITAIPLYVPAGSIESYKNHPFWGMFLNIRESVSSGIPTVYENQSRQVKWFDLHGRPLSDIPDRGLYILTDGQTSKVMYTR